MITTMKNDPDMFVHLHYMHSLLCSVDVYFFTLAT